MEWLELGCFKCLEAGYLDKLMFNILDRHPNDAQAVVLESYVFSVAAGGADTHAQVKKSAPNRVAITLPRVSKQDVHVSTQKLIKTLMTVTSSLPALPSVRWLSISIAYNALAPQGYQAPDFDPIDPKQDAGFAAGQAVEQVALGSVFTGHQHMSVQCCRAETSVSASAVGSTQRCEDAEDDGYHSDNTDLKWNKEKLELARQAEHVIKQAVRAGMCPKLALESSTQLSQAIPQALVRELVQRHQQPVVSYKRSKVT